jgi:aerobic carbon-monoxide dehydrogenase small subunit
MDVLTPHTLDEALRAKADHPDAWPIQGGTDVMVALNFDRGRPASLLNLNEVEELRGWSRDNGALRLGSGLTYAEIEHGELKDVLPALAEASRTVGSPQIRNRGTIGGNLGTSSPAGDALPPLLVEDAEVECMSVRGMRRIPLGEFVTGVKRNALEPDELITAVWLTPSNAPQTFMKIGPRNAMVIAVVSLAVSAGDELRASFGSASPRPVLACRGGCIADRRRARHGVLSPACAAGADHARAEAGARMRISLTINGEQHEADCWEGESLLFALREKLGFPGSKNACEQGECGSCSVLLDGTLVCACLVLAVQADGHDVVTVEGLADGEELHPVQEAFVEAGAVQCGFCTPGLVVATVDLLKRTPSPSDDEIREALSGNLCRCTGYAKIFDAVRLAASRS